MLKEIFESLAGVYSEDKPEINRRWLEIENAYSGNGRYYHNLTHLENLLAELQGFRPMIDNWNVVLWAMYYHDIVYDPLRSDNEAESVVLAENRLKMLNVPQPEIEACAAMIFATKGHQVSEHPDINLFTDADLSILGKEKDDYHTYASNVRREYAIYPDSLYNPGRKNVLQHFLAMEQIFKTEVFRNKYEVQARANIREEMERLG
ncbi:MAG: hypothetical protein R3C61_16390 [Bacteroidia bacterium]